MKATLSSNNERWGTPGREFKPLDEIFEFTLDVCAERWSAKVPRFFSEKDDGLSKSWAGETFFCNPPYGRRIGWWVDKARRECALNGAQGVLVLPARVDADWWRTFVLQHDGLAGRLLKSHYAPIGSVWWLLFERLVVGIRFEDHRWEFDLPPGSTAVEESAPFPTATVIMSDAQRERPVWSCNLLEGWPVVQGRASAPLGTERRSRGSGVPISRRRPRLVFEEAMIITAADRSRFWSKVDRRGPRECWPWNGSRNSERGGYGNFNLGGKCVAASRVALALKLGKWPEHRACHTCDNPPCCNPAHLYDGTAKQNAADAAGRIGKWSRLGFRSPFAKLNPGEVLTIKAALRAGVKRSALAAHFKVSTTAIRHIERGRNWRHVA